MRTDVAVRPMRREEAGLAAGLLTRHDRRRLFSELYAVQPMTFPLVATAGEEIVGLVVGNQHGSVGWIGHLVVHQLCREMHVGSALLDACITTLQRAGCVTLVSSAESSVADGMFQARGFAEQGVYHLMRRQGSLAPAARVRALCPDDRDLVLELDRCATGEDRSHLLDRWLSHGWGSFTGDGRLRAFWVPFPFGAPGAGPLIAKDPAGAMEILRQQQHQQCVNAVCLDGNQEGRRVLERCGFGQVGIVPRLVRGQLREFRPDWIYGIYSLALG